MTPHMSCSAYTTLRMQKSCIFFDRISHLAVTSFNAVTETDNPTIRKGLYDRIAQLEAAQKEIEAAIAQEVIPFPSLTEPKIRFFLTALRDGSVKDIKYRKMLIRLFVNRIWDDCF